MKELKINIPTEVDMILKKINEAGYDAYIVGGCVRDSLLGKTPYDWDITTSARPEEVKRIFRKTVDTGLKHGTVTVLMPEDQYEVTTYRVDGEYTDGRHPDKVSFTGLLSEDLKRRDFTINAMAYHPSEGLVDLFGGIEDLENKIIRCVGQAKERFSEDALRMMRAIRFSAQLEFNIEDETFKAIKELATTLSKISAERIREEMLKLLLSDNPIYFRLFYETGLTTVFMPEFDKAMETNQNHPHHMYSVGEHILHALENSEKDKAIRLTMLFHDIAKPETLTIDEDGITHFKGHPQVSAKMAGEIMTRLHFDNDTIAIVKKLTEYHDRTIELSMKATRRALGIIGIQEFPLLLKVKYADIMAQSNYLRKEKLENIEELKKLYNEVVEAKQCVKLSDLAVSGKDLINAGVLPGPGIGKILNDMLADVIDNPDNNNKEYLLKKYV